MSNLSIWDPFSELASIRERINNFFDNRFFDESFFERKSWFPQVNVKEEDGEYIVTAELPGMKIEDVDVEVHGNVLTIKGEKKFEEEEKKDKYHRIERRYGSFCRSFTLPSEIDAGRIDGSYKDGILTLHIPKREEARPRKIKIKT